MPCKDGTWAQVLPGQEELLRTFSYDKETGVLTRITGRFKGPVRRYEAPDKPPSETKIKGFRYKISRIAYKMVTGLEPPDIMDHGDMDPTNNRWDNIRPATRQENAFNRKRIKRKLNVPRGVYPGTSGRWIVSFNWLGESRRYYYESDYAEACRISFAVAKVLHADFYRDHREDFEEDFGYREPEREWYPHGPFKGVKLSQDPKRNKNSPEYYMNKNGRPRGVKRYTKDLWTVYISDGEKRVCHYTGPSYEKACQVAIEVHKSKVPIVRPTRTKRKIWPIPTEPPLPKPPDPS